MSLARPFYDFCRRDQVFLVIVVFKFEFVVRRSGALNLVSTVRTLFDMIDRRAYSALGWDVLRGSNNLRTVETARIWIQSHDRCAGIKLLVGA